MSYDATILADTPVAYWKLEELILPPSLPNLFCIDSADGFNGSLIPAADGHVVGLPGPILTDAVSYGQLGPCGRIPDVGGATGALETLGAQSWECWSISSGLDVGTMFNRGLDASVCYLSYGQRSTGNFIDNAWWILPWIVEGVLVGRELISCTLTRNVWHHVVVTYDGVSAMRMYVDSWLVASRDDAPPAPIALGLIPWRLGYITNLFFGPVFLSAGLSHCAVYDYVLTPTQIIAHNVAALGARASNPCGETPTIEVGCPEASGVVGEPFNASVPVIGGTPPYTFMVIAGALPDGLTLDPDTGVISGTPTTAGVFGFIIEVTDSEALTGTSPSCGIIVDEQPPVDVPRIGTFRFDAGLGSRYYLVPAVVDSGNELRSKTMKAMRATGKLTNASMLAYGYDVSSPINTDDLEAGTNASTRAQALPDSAQVAQSPRKPINVKNAVLSTARLEGDDTGETVRDTIHEIVIEQAIQGARR